MQIAWVKLLRVKMTCRILFIDQGHGYHFSIDGAEKSGDPWYNISCQGFQVCAQRTCCFFLLV
jgi:hypothetical protein